MRIGLALLATLLSSFVMRCNLMARKKARKSGHRAAGHSFFAAWRPFGDNVTDLYPLDTLHLYFLASASLLNRAPIRDARRSRLARQ
jgi:hypothetical protein